MFRMPGVFLAATALVMTGCDFDVDMGVREHEDFHYSYALKSNGHLELENFNEVVQRLKAIIELQEKYNKDTKERHQKSIHDLLD